MSHKTNQCIIRFFRVPRAKNGEWTARIAAGKTKLNPGHFCPTYPPWLDGH